MTTSDHFGFAKLLVTNLDESAEFYESVFGLERRFRIPYAINDRSLEEIIFRSDSGPTFGLLKFEATTQRSSDEVILGFFTNDIAGVIARALAAGGLVVRAPNPEPEYGVTVAFIADNEGHLIEVTEPL